MKPYNLKIGLPVCLLIAVLMPLPRLTRLVSTGQFLQITAGYLVFTLIAWLGSQYLVGTAFFRRARYAPHLLFVMALIYGMLVSWLFDHLISLTGSDLLFPAAKAQYPSFIIRGTLADGFIAFLVFHLHQMGEKEQSQLELGRLKQAQLQANISLLKEQLSPHFLFNTFGTLTTLTREQPVIDYVEELANVYRYLLSHQHHDWVTLRDELAFTESYLYILKTRLEDAIQINIEIDPRVLDHKIPPLTLQLLVENTIKHNVTAAAKPLTIHIHSAGDELMVTNNLQPKHSVAPSSGIGLTNIAQRYELLFGEAIRIERSLERFTVTLPLIQ